MTKILDFFGIHKHGKAKIIGDFGLAVDGDGYGVAAIRGKVYRWIETGLLHESFNCRPREVQEMWPLGTGKVIHRYVTSEEYDELIEPGGSDGSGTAKATGGKGGKSYD